MYVGQSRDGNRFLAVEGNLWINLKLIIWWLKFPNERGTLPQILFNSLTHATQVRVWNVDSKNRHESINWQRINSFQSKCTAYKREKEREYAEASMQPVSDVPPRATDTPRKSETCPGSKLTKSATQSPICTWCVCVIYRNKYNVVLLWQKHRKTRTDPSGWEQQRLFRFVLQFIWTTSCDITQSAAKSPPDLAGLDTAAVWPSSLLHHFLCVSSWWNLPESDTVWHCGRQWGGGQLPRAQQPVGITG